MTTDTERAQVGEGRGGCECAACKVTPHTSDCAVHNEPAMPAGPCDCGAPSGVPGTFNEQEKELGACSISRATIGDRTHDRGNEESHRGVGEEEQRSGEAGRRDATRAGGAELGARGGDAVQHEASEGGGTGDGAASGVTPTAQTQPSLTPREVEILREIRLHAKFDGLNEGWQREARNLLLGLERFYAAGVIASDGSQPE